MYSCSLGGSALWELTLVEVASISDWCAQRQNRYWYESKGISQLPQVQGCVCEHPASPLVETLTCHILGRAYSLPLQA
jgi:hypothetical protein